MRKFSSRFFATTAILLAGAAAATPAAAQRVDRIIALGDSYIDDGNVFELTGQPRPAVYPNGRFSNGTNLVDTLSMLLDVPVLNYGIGGAVARASNTPIPQVQWFGIQVQSFLAGGGPAAFPRSSGSFAPTDLLIVNIGANDARAYARTFGVNPTADQLATLQADVHARATLAAADTSANLNALVAAGARNITVLGGNTGILPEMRNLPISPIGAAYSSTYNAQVRQTLAGYAAQGVIVNYLDLTAIAQRVEANPGAYGLQSAGACPVSCVTTNPELLDRYLFYVDQLHLTSAGFAIIGQYAAAQLEAPLHLEAQGETALLTAESFGEALQHRLDLNSADEAGDGPPLRVFFGVDYGQRRVDESMTSLAFRAERWSGTGGIEYDGGSWLIGAAASLGRGDTSMLGTTAGIESDSIQGGVYASWSGGGAFVEAYGGIGQVDLDIRRHGVIDEIAGETDGNTIAAGGEIGYLFNAGPVRVGPVVGLAYARAELDGFTETGDAALTLTVQDQDIDQLVGHAGIELNGSFDIGGSTVAPFLTATVEKPFDDAPRTIRYAGTAAPEIVNQWVVGGEEEEVSGRLGLGANLHVTRGVTVQVAGSTTIGQEHGDESGASVALRVGF